MSKERKPFGQTKVGQLLRKVGSPVLDIVGNVVPGADVLSNVLDMVMGDDKIPAADKETILAELNKEIEMAKIEAEDRASARTREVELAKAGGSNWLMYISGVFALGLLGFIGYVIVYRTLPEDNAPLFHQLIGLIEGVVISIYTYYFGSSKSSADKNKLIK